jgi:Protein of unknown function (DUF2891)
MGTFEQASLLLKRRGWLIDIEKGYQGRLTCSARGMLAESGAVIVRRSIELGVLVVLGALSAVGVLLSAPAKAAPAAGAASVVASAAAPVAGTLDEAAATRFAHLALACEWLQPGVVTDRADPKLAHIDGLNLSRAWMLEGIAHGLKPTDKRVPALLAAAASHRAAALPAVTGEHYEGGHWLGTFAVYLTSQAGLATTAAGALP